MSNNPHLSIVIPMYNEEKRIGDTLHKILDFMKDKNYSWEIVAMDDGSRDRSIAVAKEILGGEPHRVIPNEHNMGKGATIRRGMLEAKGDLRLFTDADLSTPIEELDKLMDSIDKGYQVAIGSRALKESQLLLRQPWYREMMGRTFNVFVQILHLPGIKDTQCGFKLFTKEAAEAVFPLQSMKGFCFDVEILALAKRFGYRIVEVPVRWIDSPQSKVNPIKDSAKMFWDLLRLKFKRY
ncbi:MAG TPA: glycosyltransferase family 2 protein [Candidatus Sumerlaeota bacterium]|nr:glycosyltransferase family 2 protein [Candidatus Sumerlaeota bacterium]